MAKLDIRNAYNELCRRQIFRTIAEDSRLAVILNLILFLYDSPSSLLLRAGDGVVKILKSQNGVRQGGPLSTVLFCLVIHRALSQLTVKFPQVSVHAIADDIHLVGPPASVDAAIEFFAATLRAQYHLDISSKSAVLWAYSNNPPENVTSVCRKHKLSLILGAVETLGGVIGLDILNPNEIVPPFNQGIAVVRLSSRIEVVRRLWRPHLELLDTLTNSDLPNQHFLYLLRNQ